MSEPKPASRGLKVLNAETATFDCVYPVCGGACCKNGRPGLEPAEAERIGANLEKFLPELRPAARRRIKAKGFVTKRSKEGRPTLAVSEGACVFFNEGCALHKVGAIEGDRYRYKPWLCVTFPLALEADGNWYVRQWGLNGEAWDVFCLNPKESEKIAGSGLAGEIEFAGELEGGAESWRRPGKQT